MEQNLKKHSNKPFDPLIRLIVLQVSVCALLLMAAFAVKLIGGDLYEQCRRQYIADFEDTTDIGEVLDLLSSDGQKDGQSSDVSALPVSAGGETQEDKQTDADEPDEQDASSYEFDLSQVQQMASVRLASNSMGMPYSGGRITSKFGYRVNPVSGRYKLHGGLDIGLDMGDDIYAALPGTVSKAASSSDYGNFVVIDHGSGLQTLYAHCSKLLVKEGDIVKKGDTVALVGSTGVSTGPHLHFEVRVGGTRIDPLIVLPQINEA